MVCATRFTKPNIIPNVFGLVISLFLVLSSRPAAAYGPPDSLADLVDKLGPAVVNIYTTETVKAPITPYHYFFQDQQDIPEFFRRFFDVPPPRGGQQTPEREMKRTSLGSGIITSSDGYILTNNHVVENADKINVRLSTYEEHEAKVIGRDPKTDVALIKIDTGKALPAVTFGDSDQLRVGDWVMAIGNPFGFEQTVTVGIVSAKGRSIGSETYEDFIQTDASINPGNSGGPLFDMNGRMVGINTAIFSRGGGNIGIGFAIPVNMTVNVMNQLKTKGKVIRGWLGVMIQQVTSDIAHSFGLERPIGALVGEITPGSPAQEAGIKPGDVIIEYNGKTIEQMNMLPAMVAQTPIGTKASLVIVRDGKQKTVTVTIGELKEEEQAAGAKEGETGHALGISVQPLTPELADTLSLKKDRKGVVVVDVEPGSRAEEVGIRRGDLIIEINRQPVANMNDYNRILDKAKGGKNILFLVLRESHTRFIVMPTK